MSHRLHILGHLAAFTVLALALTLSGCGLTGDKGLADTDAATTDIEVLTEQVSLEEAETASTQTLSDASTENHVTQAALGRMPDQLTVDMPPLTLTRVMPASSRSNLIRNSESPDDLPMPERETPAVMPPQTAMRPMVGAAPVVTPLQAPLQPRSVSGTDLGPLRQQPVVPRTVDKVGTADFEQVVLESDVPVLVDFYADWCGPCKQVAPLLNVIARDHAGLRVVKVNIDHDKKLARQYRIKSIPTVIVFNQGKLIAQHTGLPSIQKALAKTER